MLYLFVVIRKPRRKSETKMIGPAQASTLWKIKRAKEKREHLANLPALIEKFERDHIDEATEEAIELAFTHGVLGALNTSHFSRILDKYLFTPLSYFSLSHSTPMSSERRFSVFLPLCFYFLVFDYTLSFTQYPSSRGSNSHRNMYS